MPPVFGGGSLRIIYGITQEYSHSITFTIIYYQKYAIFALLSMVQFIITV